jgi:hypothetical protein
MNNLFAKRLYRYLAGICCAGLVACDPGWRYMVPGGVPVEENGRRYKLTGPDSTTIRVYGSSFAFDLSVAMDVTNGGLSALHVRPETFAVLRHDGVPIQANATPVCRGLTGTVVNLDPGETCSIDARFRLRPTDPDTYRSLTVTLPGVMRAGREVDISVRLVKARKS